ncbi:RHS repeat-associated core domain-containing protein [Sorangium cellulosum]
MKGRMHDPRIGRFLTTDPIVSNVSFGQNWNPYSYVLNNPLVYVDPGGFQEAIPEGGARAPLAAGAEFTSEELGLPPIEVELVLPEHEARSGDGTSTMAAETGGAVPPIDVGVVGTSAGFVPQPVTTAPIDWSQNPYVPIEGGFVAGVLLGAVPFAGVGHQLLDAAGALPHGTTEARMGLAIGQIVGGIALTNGGLTGELFGGVTSVGDPRVPRPVGEDRGHVIAGVHRSPPAPAPIWAALASAG